ncbi:DUF5324 family protein [Kitasatospora sp. NPDC006697]|uniref:DUF5324 family protein n=1 Tax=Kitasatospora sp. NPDC006697 TaxID=3364020 RepID=UPI0036C18340
MEDARESAGRTLESLAPFAATARESAAQYADEARQRLGPALEAAAEQARQGAHSAREGYQKHLVPRVGHAWAALPPKSQENALKAVHRAQEAALAAKHSADHAVAAAVPVVQEAQARGTAALTALQGGVSAEEIGRLAERNRRHSGGRGSRLLAVAGLLAIGGGLLAWGWSRRSREPEWLVEPPQVQSTPDPVHPVSRPSGATAAGEGGPAGLNGSGPADPEPADEDGPEKA